MKTSSLGDVIYLILFIAFFGFLIIVPSLSIIGGVGVSVEVIHKGQLAYANDTTLIFADGNVYDTRSGPNVALVQFVNETQTNSSSLVHWNFDWTYTWRSTELSSRHPAKLIQNHTYQIQRSIILGPLFIPVALEYRIVEEEQ